MILFLWIICAIVCGVMADAKGLKPIGWVFGGLLFGIFAIILLACIPSNKKS